MSPHDGERIFAGALLCLLALLVLISLSDRMRFWIRNGKLNFRLFFDYFGPDFFGPEIGPQNFVLFWADSIPGPVTVGLTVSETQKSAPLGPLGERGGRRKKRSKSKNLAVFGIATKN